MLPLALWSWQQRLKRVLYRVSVVGRKGGREGGADAVSEARVVSLGAGLDSRKEDATVFRMQAVPQCRPRICSR